MPLYYFETSGSASPMESRFNIVLSALFCSVFFSETLTGKFASATANPTSFSVKVYAGA